MLTTTNTYINITSLHMSSMSFSPSTYVSAKVEAFVLHIASQHLPFVPKLYLDVTDLNALATLALVAEAKKLHPEAIGEIVAARIKPDDSTYSSLIKEYCESLGVKYVQLDITEDVEREATIMSNTIRVQSVTDKLYRDKTRGILYYVAKSTKGMVLTCLNKSDREIGNFSKSSDRVGDWNLIGDITNMQVRELSRHFGISSVFIDAQERIDYDFEQKFNVTYRYINTKDGEVAEKRRYDAVIVKNLHKHRYPYNLDAKLPNGRSVLDDDGIDQTVMYTTPFPMHPELTTLLGALRTTDPFRTEEWITEKVVLFFEYLKKYNIQAVTLLVSGGVDSACVLGLAKECKKRYGLPKKIILVAVPISSTSTVQNRAYENCTAQGLPCYTVDLTESHEILCAKVSGAFGFERSRYADGCFRSSMRAPVGYYVSRINSCFVGQANGIVLGTGNRSEDGKPNEPSMGFFTKDGDGLVDLQLIADLYKADVYKVAQKLGTIRPILEALPTADLGMDQNTDEGELGFSYDTVELCIRLSQLSEEDQSATLARLSEEAKMAYDVLFEKITRVHKMNAHKFEMPLYI